MSRLQGDFRCLLTFLDLYNWTLVKRSEIVIVTWKKRDELIKQSYDVSIQELCPLYLLTKLSGFTEPVLCYRMLVSYRND